MAVLFVFFPVTIPTSTCVRRAWDWFVDLSAEADYHMLAHMGVFGQPLLGSRMSRKCGSERDMKAAHMPCNASCWADLHLITNGRLRCRVVSVDTPQGHPNCFVYHQNPAP